MTVVFIVVGVIVLAVIAQLALGKWNDTTSDNELPDSVVMPLSADAVPVTAEEIDGLRFSLAFRGYRIEQVDQVLDQLSATVALQSAEIERLKAGHIQASQNEG